MVPPAISRSARLRWARADPREPRAYPTLLASTTPNVPVPAQATLAPFRARKEPVIDDIRVQRIRVILGLGVVNLVLVVAAVLVGGASLIH